MNQGNPFLTHNGILTVRSEATGDHRTFRVRTMDEDSPFAPGRRVVELLTGPDNTASYTGFGFLDVVEGRVRIQVWRKRAGAGEQYPRLAGMLEMLEEHAAAGRITLHFAGCCRRCNRALTTPESIEAGIGPVCAGLE